MIYYSDGILVIRTMEEADAQIFTDEEAEQGWHSDISKYLTRLRDQAEGKCVSLTAVYEGHPAGYINVYKTGLGGAFSGKGWPEIVDFGVLERFQRNGIGSKLMDIAEQIAGQEHKIAFVLSAQTAKLPDELPLLLPPLGRLPGGQGGEGGIQVQIRRVKKSNHGQIPFLWRCSGRCRCRR